MGLHKRSLRDLSLGRGGSWSAAGTILFSATQLDGVSQVRVSASGGTSAPVTTLDVSRGESSHQWPRFLPDGRRFLYSVGSRTRHVMIV